MNGVEGSEAHAADIEVDEQQAQYMSLKVIVNAVSTSCSRIILSELKKLLGTPEVNSRMKNGIMPYIYAAGFLSFAGREISADNIGKLMSSVGLAADSGIMDVLNGSNLKSHLIYVYAFYFLMANGVAPTSNEVMAVVEAMGMHADEAVANEAIKACSAMGQ